MTPYLILAAAVAVFGFFLCEKHPGRRSDLIFLTVTSAALIVMAAIRNNTVGIDYWQSYLPYFQRVCEGGTAFLFSPANEFRIEIGYSLLNYLISLIGSSQLVFATAIGVLTVGLTAVFLYKYSPSVWVSMFVFITFGFYGYTLVTIRHQIAICIFMFALPHLQNKKFVPYALIVLLSATFHKSMLILLVVYFLAQLPLGKITLGIYGGGTLLFLLFSEPIMNFLTTYIYKSYQVGTYYMQGRDFQTGFFPIVLFGVVLLMKKRLLAHNPKALPLINLCCYSALLFVATYKHFVFQRIALIFLPVALLLLPELLKSLAIGESDRLVLNSAKKALTAGGGDKKRALQKYGEIKARLHDQQAMYYAAIGFILFSGFVYFLFLLVANRLLLVPYLTMWSGVLPPVL